jgi:hypothetical protein
MLKRMFSAYPELYLDDAQAWFYELTGEKIALNTLWRYLTRLGFSYKKLSHAAMERNERVRQDYREFVTQFRPEMFVFVDESSKNSRTPQRMYGYLPKGRWNQPYKCNFVKRGRVSVMAALDYYGILGHLVVEGSYTAELFNPAFSQQVLPHLGVFMHHEDRSIVVMDNCRVHDAQLVQMVREKGAILVFLPPYSPDLMPIEFAFHFLKCWLRRHRGLADKYPKMCISRAFEEITETIAQNYIHHCGY